MNPFSELRLPCTLLTFDIPNSIILLHAFILIPILIENPLKITQFASRTNYYSQFNSHLFFYKNVNNKAPHPFVILSKFSELLSGENCFTGQIFKGLITPTFPFNSDAAGGSRSSSSTY